MEEIKKEPEVVEQEEVKEILAEETNLVHKQSTESQKKNIGQVLLEYFKGICYNIKDAFKYNRCLLPGLLILLPGLFIGFFLGIHSNVQFYYKTGELDFSGLLMFILVLFGCINIFNGVTFITKKNLGTIVISSVCSAVITVSGVFWIQKIFYSKWLIDSGVLTPAGTEEGVKAVYQMTSTVWLSIIAVILSIVCSLAGCILGYFMRNKNYKKVKF